MNAYCPYCGSRDLGVSLAAVRTTGRLYVSARTAETPNAATGPLTDSLVLRTETGRFLTAEDFSSVTTQTCFQCEREFYESQQIKFAG